MRDQENDDEHGDHRKDDGLPVYRDLAANEIEDAVSLLDDVIKKEYKNVQRIFIEGEARHSILK